MKTKHTPGPWELGKAYSRDKDHWYAVVFSPAKTGSYHTPRAAEAFGVTKAECEANARLIAAAPDLLETLTECITDDGAYCFGAVTIAKLKRRIDTINAAARAAIAKATK